MCFPSSTVVSLENKASCITLFAASLVGNDIYSCSHRQTPKKGISPKHNSQSWFSYNVIPSLSLTSMSLPSSVSILAPSLFHLSVPSSVFNSFYTLLTPQIRIPLSFNLDDSFLELLLCFESVVLPHVLHELLVDPEQH